jgi:hypothetical protein
MHSSTSEDFARRAVLPELMFFEDVGLALQVEPDEAEQAMLRGECGPVLVLGDRVAVLRTSFLASLAAREFRPAADGGHS